MPQNTDQASLVFRLEVAQGHLAAVSSMLETGEPLDKVLHQICAVQSALDKVKIHVQNELLKQSISAIRENPCAEVEIREVNKLLSLYTVYSRR